MCSPHSIETERNFWQSLCSCRKYSCFPHNFLWVGMRGSVRPKIQRNVWNLIGISRGVGWGWGLWKNPFHGRDMEILWNYTFHRTILRPKCSTICLVIKTYQGLSTSSRTNQQNRIAFSILCTSFDKIQQLSGDKYQWKSLRVLLLSLD